MPKIVKTKFTDTNAEVTVVSGDKAKDNDWRGTDAHLAVVLTEGVDNLPKMR